MSGIISVTGWGVDEVNASARWFDFDEAKEEVDTLAIKYKKRFSIIEEPINNVMSKYTIVGKRYGLYNADRFKIIYTTDFV